MIAFLLRAFADLAAPPLRRIVWHGLALAIASLAAVWLALIVLLGHLGSVGWRPLDWLIDLLGAAAAFALAWVLFPAVVTLVMGFFLDRVAAAVEALNYPGRSAARTVPIRETIMTTSRLMGLTIILNILALPIYVLMPGLNFFVFVALNGYLFGREYFEVVALRRLDPIGARTMRQRFAGRVLLGGMAIAGLFALPVANLVAPVIATAFMVHFFEGLRASSQLPAS